MPGTPDPRDFLDQSSWAAQIREEQSAETLADLTVREQRQATYDAAIAAEDHQTRKAPASLAGWALQVRQETAAERGETWTYGEGPSLPNSSCLTRSEELGSGIDWDSWNSQNPGPEAA